MRSHSVPQRYGIYWANLDPAKGSEMKKLRPVVVVSPEAMNRHLETIVVCPLTSKIHSKWSSRLQVRCAEKPSEVAVDQIRTISKSRLRNKLDSLSPEKAKQLREIVIGLYGR